MRQYSLGAALAAAVLLSVAPVRAQEAGDCGVVCRLQGYLSTDHMTDEAPAPAAPAAAGKPHRHAAAPRKPPVESRTAIAPKTAAPPASKPATVASARPVAPKPKAARLPAVKAAVAEPASAARPVPPPARPAAVAAAKAAPARIAAAPIPERRPPQPRVAAIPAPKPAAPSPRPASVKVAAASAAKAVAPAPAAASPRAAPPPVRTAAAWSLIPGSAPAMQAGFH